MTYLKPFIIDFIIEIHFSLKSNIKTYANDILKIINFEIYRITELLIKFTSKYLHYMFYHLFPMFSQFYIELAKIVDENYEER